MFAEELAVFPSRYGGHLTLSIAAIATGLAVSIPLGIRAAAQPRLAGPALGAASLVQTIPGIALLALMVPLLGGRIGFWPAYCALTLYSVLPILRNTIVGLQGVDAGIREAALGVGMTPGQSLVRVQLPIAAPVIVAGLRTSSVWVVGAATLSTPVGAESLGNYIFQGLQTRNWGAVVFGCLASAGLALVLDQTIRLFERAAEQRSKRLAGFGAAGLALVAAPLLLALPSAGPAPAPAADFSIAAPSLEGRQVTIAAKSFTEQYILADLIAGRLEAAGARVDLRQGLGSTLAFDALASGEIDLYVDYTGTVWATLIEREDVPPRAVMYAETSAWLWDSHGVLAFAPLGFENAYAYAVTQQTAQAKGLSAVGDLAGSGLTLASDPEFFGRPEWVRTRDLYGLADLSVRGMESTFMYEAVASGEVDVITAYTTDGRIDAYGLVLLDEPAGALPPYDAFILMSPRAAQDRALHTALAPLAQAIDSQAMRSANGRVDIDRVSVSQAAGELARRIDADAGDSGAGRGP
ncbi:MAG: ABC transporter permease/substrate-binding protein [Pseudomonadota bacterium]